MEENSQKHETRSLKGHTPWRASGVRKNTLVEATAITPHQAIRRAKNTEWQIICSY